MKFLIFLLTVLAGCVATDIDIKNICQERGEYQTHLGLGKTIKCEVLK